MPLILAVLDTNVLVSALCLPHSLPAQLLRRFAMTEDKAQAFVQLLRDLAILTPGKLTVQAVLADPKDDHVVACALEGEAGFIVSGDRHLRELKEYEGIHVLSPAQFLGLLQQQERQQQETQE